MALSPVPLVRRPHFDFGSQAVGGNVGGEGGEGIGRHWFGGSALRTHLANGLNFVFPEGERFFIRSVRHYADRLDPELKVRVAALAGQEAQHQRAHLASFELLEAQGYEVASWLAWYESVGYRRIEPRVPPVLRLATTAALEHFTATFGELVLRTEMLDTAHPTMRALLRWHAAEEIEHRDVAYDVLLVVDPRWAVRALGFVMAGGLLAFFWSSGVRHLRRQDPPRGAVERAAGQQVRTYWRRHGPAFARALLAYLRPGFHPRDAGGDALAEAFFAEGTAGEHGPVAT
ncbi:MAG: metal-dependent hydrolase [Myxococcota bacterium]